MHRRSLIALPALLPASTLSIASDPLHRHFQLHVNLPGWDAERVRDQMAGPLEAWLIRLPLLTRYASQSAEQRYAVSLSFSEPGVPEARLRAQLAEAPALVGQRWTLSDGPAPAET